MAPAGRMMEASMVLAVLMVAVTARPVSSAALAVEGEDTVFGTAAWWGYAGLSAFLVLFAGLMSGLSLGLMSISLVDLEILLRSGSNTEKAQAGYLCVMFAAAAIFPVVQMQHRLLVTLLLYNACAMEALPIFLDRIFNPVLAIFLSVTFVLAFGEVIPQAICTRYGLAVGASFVWLVRILMAIAYPIAYPIGKLLDFALGHEESALFRRAQLKALVSIHSKEAGKGGELTHDETTIISGALDLTLKTAEEAMTPIESIFSLDIDSKLDWETIGQIISRGHSRVPVYSGNPRNFIGILLVKTLLTVRASVEPPVSAVSLRSIPRVPADMPLYDILNLFQKGGSHMAAVVNVKPKNALTHDITESSMEETQLTAPLLSSFDERAVIVDNKRQQNMQVNRNKAHSKQLNDTPSNKLLQLPEDMDCSEVIGIITLEDVFEELLQEEIVDETDEYVDVHKRIRVAAAVAASAVSRVPSYRRLISQRGAGAQGQGQPSGILKKSTGDANLPKHKVNVLEPLL